MKLRPRRTNIPPPSGLEAGFVSAGAGPYPSNIVIGGHTAHLYGNQDYNTPWMLQTKIGTSPANALLRCEVRPGYSGLLTDNVNVSQRATFAFDEDYQAFDTNYWHSCSIYLPSGPPNQIDATEAALGGWFNLMEWRQTSDGSDTQTLVSPMYFKLIGDTELRLETRGSNQNPTIDPPTQVRRWTDTSFARGQWNHFVVRVKWSPSGSGELQVWKNGVEVVNVTGISIGYNDTLGPTHRILIYRGRVSSPGTDTQVAYFANVEWGTSSLLARVASPLAIPDNFLV